MALPAAVQKQVEEAEALQQQLYSAPEPAPAEQPEAEVAEATEVTPSNVVELQRNAEPVPVETPKAAETNDESAYWKKRFDTVQGILNAETSKLQAQLKEQNSQIQQLLAQLQEKSSQPPEADVATSKDTDDYGADLVAMVDRRATALIKQAVSQAVAEVRKEFGAVEARVGQVQEQVYQSAEEKFWGEVMSLVPDWKLIDQSPQWIEWLDTTPEFAEDTYREMAVKAIRKGDAQKIAKLVELWRGPKQTEPKPDPQAELQRQVAPSTSKSSASPPPAAKIWTRAEYEAAMDHRNVQRMGQKKAEELEAAANAAVAEGRVRW